MRPLIEILEDERTLMHKIDSVHRYLVKTDDWETIKILKAQLDRIERDLEKVRNEMKEYVVELIDHGE